MPAAAALHNAHVLSDNDFRRRLRAALVTLDGSAVTTLLTQHGLREYHLQLIGDCVLVAVDQRVSGARELATTVAAQLAERGWAGDDELRQQLDRASGGAVPLLRPIPTNLDEVAEAMDTGPDFPAGRLNLRTGEVDTSPDDYLSDDFLDDTEDDTTDDTGEDAEDLDSWLRIEPTGSRVAWWDMRDFIDTVADAERADRLLIAVEGKGAFRRFRNVIDRWPDEEDRWRAFADDRRRGRAREWLAEEGYRAVPVERS